MSLTHSQLIKCLRKFADELEERRPQLESGGTLVYQKGGYQARLFLEYGLEIRATVTGETWDDPCQVDK